MDGGRRSTTRPRQLNDPYPEVLQRTLRHVVDRDRDAAQSALAEIPFTPLLRRKERWPPTSVVVRIFMRDHYQCRYCGEKTVLPQVMRLLSRLFPAEFPYHPNWKAELTHPAFVSRSTTLDHQHPIAGGGDPVDVANLVTACWGCNRRKGDLTLDELGWPLREPSDLRWFGLTELYEPAWNAAGRPPLGETEMTWLRATKAALESAT